MDLLDKKHSIGKTIAKLRKDKKLTQAELATKLNVSDKTISKWESEAGLPEISQLPSLGKVFGVTIDYLMKGERQEKASNANKSKTRATPQEIEKKIESAMFNEIVDIEKLVKTDDFDAIKEGLCKKPIHICEVISTWIENEQWPDLYRFAIDYGLAEIARNVIYIRPTHEDVTVYIDILKESVNNALWKNTNRGEEFLALLKLNEKFLALREEPRCVFDCFDSVFLQKCKQQILNDVSIKMDKDKLTAGLTREYFNKELEKNLEMVIIKLCVKLEAILKCDYHYVGELKEMIDAYCIKYGYVEDGWGNRTRSEESHLLNKLRICRNNIVHSVIGDEQMTPDEIKKSIDYVFSMGV